MPTFMPQFLMMLAVLLAAASVAALVLAGIEMYQRFSANYLATLGIDEGMRGSVSGAEAAAAGSFDAVRRTLIAFLAAVNQRSVPAGYLETLRKKLVKAGVPLDFTPAEIVALMEIGAASGLFLWLFFTLLFRADFHFWVAPVVMSLGFVYPLIWLKDRINQRHHAIVRALPYNLDLLTLSVEAGLDFAAAIGKVVEKGRKGPLADEFAQTLRELKLGKTREEALRNLAGRVDMPTLTTFVNALIQADKMGTPLGKILRILATQMRTERTQRAEKLANEAPVKMLFPLIGFIFPTIFIILFGPIVFSVFFIPH